MTLMQKLIIWQQEQARKEHLEPYMVLQFNTIKEIIRIQPKTHDELIRIKGIGPAKVRKYGDEILKTVRGNDIIGNETQSSKSNLFSEAADVNDAVLTSQNPRTNDMHFDPETGEIIESKENDTVSVTEFVTMIDTMLRTHFRSVRVQGEVVGFKQNANGHTYFEIKDDDSVLRCAVFRSNYELSGISLEDGMEIVLTGYPNYHKKYGFSFVGNTIELYGEGALKKAYDDLKKKLEQEGLFDATKKRDLPELPKKIGLVTSRTGAAIGDFTSNVGQYGYKIIFHHTSVEGAHALGEMKNAIETMAKKDVDVLILVRGGGSLESLQAFNNEKIVRMIKEFPVPVVVGVGHDEDETIATLVADLGVSTPTGAARAVRESWDQCEKRVQGFEENLLHVFEKMLHENKNNIKSLEQQLFGQLENIINYFNNILNRFFRSVQKVDTSIQSHRLHVQRLQEKICDRFVHNIDYARQLFDSTYLIKEIDTRILYVKERLLSYEKTIIYNNPERQLALGYSIARDRNGKVTRRISDVKKDDELSLQVSDGNISLQVK